MSTKTRQKTPKVSIANSEPQKVSSGEYNTNEQLLNLAGYSTAQLHLAEAETLLSIQCYKSTLLKFNLLKREDSTWTQIQPLIKARITKLESKLQTIKQLQKIKSN